MKSYTLRLEDNLLKALKFLSIEENKSIREIILELIKQKVSLCKNVKGLLDSELESKKELDEAVNILKKISDKDVILSIREDREK